MIYCGYVDIDCKYTNNMIYTSIFYVEIFVDNRIICMWIS